MNGIIPRRPKITNKVPRRTLYFGLSNFGQSDEPKTKAHKVVIAAI